MGEDNLYLQQILFPLNHEGNYVDPSLYTFIRLFYNKVYCNDNYVKVNNEYPPLKDIPCITFNIQSGIGIENRQIRMLRNPLPEDNPYFDETNEDEEYVNEYTIRHQEKRRLTINIWAYDTPTRDCIFRQVKNIISLAINGYYGACANYFEGNCETTGNECDATSEINRFSVQGKCPYLDITDEGDENYRGPENIFSKYGINKDRIFPRSPQFLVDSAVQPALYRVMWDLDIEVQESITYRTIPICAYENDDEEIME